MGSCMSRKLASSCSSTIERSSSSSSTSKYGKKIRVVHLNGWMEEFEHPITVGEAVTGRGKKLQEAKHFVFAQAQLVSLLDSKPMDSATQLEMGNIYFLLPHSIFQTEMSPMDLATISKRLTLAAAQKPVNPPSSLANKSIIMPALKKKKKKKQQQQQSMRKIKRNRYADRYVPPRINNTTSDGDIDINNHLFNYDYTTTGYNNHNNSLVVMKEKKKLGDQSPCSWKPILESITERSFTLRSTTESDSSHQDNNYR